MVHDRESLDSALTEIESRRAWWVAALDYELGYLLEPASAPPGWQPDPVRPLACFWRFERCCRLDASAAESWLQAQLAKLAPDERLAGIGGLSTGCDAFGYQKAVASVREYIAAGDCYQVNFTFPLHFECFGHPVALYEALRRRQPVRHGGIVMMPGGTAISLSPELFLERTGDRLLTRPMKGTAPRSTDQEALRQSEKDRAENLMIVDLLRNDLGRVAAGGSVRVDSLFEIEAYPTLWQMVSQVSAEVPGVGFGDILRALFPCGSITGAPKIRAMQIAAELEGRTRGLYTGSLGWIAPSGDFRLNVAIRTLEMTADGKGRLGIGSGIVSDSVAKAEWQECMLKSAFLTQLDPGLKLIETIRLEDGSFPYLARHLARLQASAAWLGYPCDESEVRNALTKLPSAGLWRVRLTLSKNGQFEIASAPLADEPPGERLARLAALPIDSRNPLRRHKTTARAIYDQVLQEIAASPEVFDVVFLNERGEVAEGARSNVFVRRDGMLLTPPLESGALPGVLRAELLAAGLAQESVLHASDLADGFMLGNALRGLVPARLATG